MPQISVIVPVYKVEPYLHRCVDSILAQTFADFELILVDDGSPDNCGAICDEYAAKDSRVTVIHQENGGLSAARNIGIDWAFANSNSQWLTFIDSDDWVDCRYLELLWSANIENDTRVSFCNLLTVFKNSEIPAWTSATFEKQPPEKAYTDDYTMINAYACGRLYAKRLFRNIRFPIGKLFEDTFITHKIIFQEPYVSVVNPPLYFYYRANSESILSSFPYDCIDNHDAFNEQINYYLEHGYEQVARIAIRKYLSEVKDRLDHFSQDHYTSENVLRLRQQKHQNFPRYARHLDINDPSDEWVLYKIYPLRTQVRVFLRVAKKRISRFFVH